MLFVLHFEYKIFRNLKKKKKYERELLHLFKVLKAFFS